LGTEVEESTGIIKDENKSMVDVNIHGQR